MSNAESKPCSVVNCPQIATEIEVAESEHWMFAAYFCDEHAREMAKGVPLGVAGLDTSRLEVRSKGTEDPQVAATVAHHSPQ
jgi:hypothetical protein